MCPAVAYMILSYYSDNMINITVGKSKNNKNKHQRIRRNCWYIVQQSIKDWVNAFLGLALVAILCQDPTGKFFFLFLSNCDVIFVPVSGLLNTIFPLKIQL